MKSLRQRINRIFIKLSYRLGKSKIWSKPKMIVIDPTNHCDLKCPMCPTGIGDKSVDRGLMTLKHYKAVIDRLGTWLQSVNMYSWGEGTLNKSFVEMVRHTACTHGIRTITNLNLNLLNDEQVEGLATSGLDKLIVSVDGATQEAYEVYRVGGNIEKVFNNMRRLVEANKRHNSNMRVIWQFLVMKQNEQQIDLAREIAKEIGVEISFGMVRAGMKEDLTEKVEDNIQKFREWMPENPDFNRYNLEEKTRKKQPNQQHAMFCKRPWMETFINWNGDVFPCGCVMTEKKYSMGNVFEEDFDDVWNGEKYIAARKELLGQGNDLETICHICKRNGANVW